MIANPLLQQFKSQRAQAESKLQELSRRYGPKHPKIIAAQSELRSATQILRDQIDVVIESIQKNYQLAKANEASLNKTYQTHKDEIQIISRKEFKLRELQLDVDTNRSLYNNFVSKLKETSASENLETTNARVIDQAIVPAHPIKPNKKRIALLSAFLAFFSAIGLAILKEAFNSTIKSTEQAEELLHLPVLGTIPLVKSKALARLVLSKKHKEFAESIRSIRTSILLNNMEKSGKVIMLTSTVPQEGKSTTASNLAIALGQMHSTILIDADMRRPSISKNFRINISTPGLANIISQNADFDECRQHIDCIDCIGAGAVPPNPLDLLSSTTFTQFIADLRNRYEFIVIDAPPLFPVSDPLMIAPHVDMLIYVISTGTTQIGMVNSGIGQLLQNKIRVSGLILNKMNMKTARYYSDIPSKKYRNYYT